MKATRLDSLAEEYKKIVLNKKESLRIFEDKQTNFKRLQQEIKDLKRKIDNHKSIVSIRDKIKLMQIELLWAKVRDAEEEVKKEEGKVNNWEKKHGNILHECSNRAERIENIKKNVT
jgi:chromosome segregation ATPase